MRRSRAANPPAVAHAERWRKRSWAGLLALALLVPGAAHPFSLEQLLLLPLEHLLQLEITPRRASTAVDTQLPVVTRVNTSRGRHVV